MTFRQGHLLDCPPSSPSPRLPSAHGRLAALARALRPPLAEETPHSSASSSREPLGRLAPETATRNHPRGSPAMPHSLKTPQPDPLRRLDGLQAIETYPIPPETLLEDATGLPEVESIQAASRRGHLYRPAVPSGAKSVASPAPRPPARPPGLRPRLPRDTFAMRTPRRLPEDSL